MIPTSLHYCDCCGLPITHVTEDKCPRCGYPLNKAQEEQFLVSSLLALKRVVTYVDINITVVQLIERYRQRLSYLQLAKAPDAEQTIQNPHLFEAPIFAPSPIVQKPASLSVDVP